MIARAHGTNSSLDDLRWNQDGGSLRQHPWVSVGERLDKCHRPLLHRVHEPLGRDGRKRRQPGSEPRRRELVHPARQRHLRLAEFAPGHGLERSVHPPEDLEDRLPPRGEGRQGSDDPSEASGVAEDVARWAAGNLRDQAALGQQVEVGRCLPPRVGDPATQLRSRPLISSATALGESGRAEVVNDVVFNQVLVRWRPPDARDPDRFNDAVVAAIQTEGTAYVSGTTWRERRLMRISISDWATDEDDVDGTVTAMLRCHEAVAGSGSA